MTDIDNLIEQLRHDADLLLGDVRRRILTAADTIETLRRWKAEAMTVLDEWEATWEAAGRPGHLGQSKAVAVRQLVAP